jgi:predicted acetyltransferase
MCDMIEFYNESDIADLDNKKLMELLQICFPMLPCFLTNRFYVERSDFRWVVRSEDKIIANAVVHDKIFLSDNKRISIAGIAGVCVHPDYRGRGLLRQMLSEVHTWARNRHYSFAFLFGKNEIYRSSGYIQCNNEFKFINHRNNIEEIKQIETAHYFSLGNKSWPTSLIDIQGPMF